MSKPPDAFSLGKWLAGIAATIVGAVMVWLLTHPGGILNPIPTPSPSPTQTASGPPPTPPHAPAIENTFDVPLFEEQQRLIKLRSGQKVTLTGEELWNAPGLTEVSCASGFIALTWIVRDPYPKGGEDLQLLSPIRQSGGLTEKVAEGASGSTTMGYCNEIILFNNSLLTYQVELRYASGVQ
jgi:hypothetical protein